MSDGDRRTPELLIRGTQIIDDGRWSDPVDILVNGARIETIAPSASPGTALSAAQVIDGTGTYAIPGLVNGHTHAHNGLVRGTGDDRWLELHILRMSESSPTWRPDDYYAAAAVAALEMVRTGTTVAVDMVSAGGPDWRDKIEAVMAAYRDVGIAATIAPGLSDIPFPETLGPLAQELDDGARDELAARARHVAIAEQVDRIADLARSLEHAERPADRVRLGIGPVNPVQCTDELFEAVADLIERTGLAMQIHCMESKVQALAGLEPEGWTTIDRLKRFGLLRRGTSLVHAVWLSDRDAETVAESGALVVHCAASNLKLGSGIAPVRRYLDRGVTVQLGADGSGSGDNQNMFQSMWLSALLSHVLTPDPDRWLTARTVFDLGARSSFADQPKAGVLAENELADIVLLDARSTFLTPRVDPHQSLVYSEAGFSVRTVVANGTLIWQDGRSTRVDPEPLIEAVDEAWQRFARDNLADSVVTRLEPALRRMQQQLPAYPYPVERHPAVGRVDA